MERGPEGDRDRGRDLTHTEVNRPTEKQLERQERRREIKRRNRRRALQRNVNWDVYQHYQLYDMIMTAEPRAMAARADDWRDLAQRIEGTTGQVERIVKELLGTWRGSAAVASAAANTRLTQWAGDASHTATRIAAGLANYTEAVVYAQRNMPEPGFSTAEHRFEDGYTVVGTGGPSEAVLLRQLLSDQIVPFEEARERKAEAVAVMRAYENQSANVHDDLPDFDAPAPVLPDQQPGASPGGSPGVSPPGPAGGGAAGGAGAGGAGAGPAAGAQTGGADDSTTAAGFADPAHLPATGNPNSGGPNPGTGYGVGLPGSGSGGDSIRGGGGGFAGGGGAAGGAGPLAARAGGPAGGVPGMAAIGGGRGAGGPAGTAGGMYPPLAGAGAGREEDGEHTNKYDKGLDLFDDLPPAYPPVFGA
ncbi:MAG TPA: PPE domain-containing protein [Actinophytocola sp.]|uniref:PPE domain-containing protein n=1 Tax=Actinophytocola sp. TaxID=1872138 RepID=UPI002DBD53C2|nr:PPE domain-containing protein [Actinophytocola sp.]HEU5469716.1 PPE domain-containing protein [Actinophytocola sp.]